MEFRFLVKGDLPPGTRGHTNTKHRIRQEIHPQMRAVFQQHPELRRTFEPLATAQNSRVENVAYRYEKYGFRFVPLVTKEYAACALSILLLRRHDPFTITNNFGDLDGRVKTILDGLRMPQQPTEVQGMKPEDDENPFFVLMEDDSSIFELNITADRLLVPPEPGEAHRDVIAIIHVRTKSLRGLHTVYDGP